MNKLETMLLLDLKSRQMLQDKNMNFSANGIYIISTLADIDELLLEKTNNLVILEGCLSNENIVSDLKLFKSLYNLNCYILCHDANNILSNLDLAQPYICDIRKLSASLVQSVIVQDKALEGLPISYKPEKETKTFAKSITHFEVDATQDVIELAESYLALDKAMNESTQQKLQLQEQNKKLQLLCTQLTESNNKLIAGNAELIEKARAVNESLTAYEIALSKDFYTKLDIQTYASRPVIFYFKVYEELEGADEFYATIMNVIMLQHKCSAKIVKLYDTTNCRAVKHAPKNYKILYNSYTQHDVVCSDYLIKIGNYTELLSILLTNRAGIDVLVIVDYKGNDDIVISGYAPLINICAKSKYLDVYGISPQCTITNDGELTDLRWELPDELVKDPGDRFVQLASTPVMEHLSETFTQATQQIRRS